MMNFFRKNMKAMLGVFMALLLVVWLGGTALTSALQASGQDLDEPVGTVYGEELTLGEQQQFGAKLDLLTSMGADPQYLPFRAGIQEPLGELECLLIYKEAVRSNLVASDAEVDKAFQEIQPEIINRIRQRQNLSIENIKDALRVFITLNKSMMQGFLGASPTEAQIQKFVKETAEKVQIHAVVFNPRDFIAGDYEPSDDEVQAQFDKYKDAEPTTTGEPSYRIPEKATVQYIKIDTRALGALREFSDREAMAYWKQAIKDNPNRFTKPQPPVAPNTPPAERPKPEPYATFPEAKPDVIKAMRDEAGRDLAPTVAKKLINALRREWANQPLNENGFRQIPDAAKNMERYQNMVDRFESEYPGALSVGKTQPFAMQSRPQEIGGARTQGGERPIPFEQVAFMVPGTSLKKTDDADQKELFRNLYETCVVPVVKGGAGDLFVFRTTEYTPAHPPKEIDDDLRERIVRDIRAERAKAPAEEAAKTFLAKAQEVGLDQAFEAMKESLPKNVQDTGVREPSPFARRELRQWGPTMSSYQPPYVYELGFPLTEEFIDLCFETSDGEESPVQMYAVEQPEQWIVFKQAEILPIERPTYEQQVQQGRQYLSRLAIQTYVRDWMNSENIKKRTNWVPVKSEAEDDEAQEEESTEES